MKTMPDFSPQTLLAGSLVTLALLFAPAAHAQQTQSLPDYVIEQFGSPPPIPSGPLSQSLQAAIRNVFVDSLEQSAWGRDQEIALWEIAESGDPRLVWVISDMMRFTWRRSFDDALASAAAGVPAVD